MYVRIKMRIYPYTHIPACSLVCMSLLIVLLLSAGYCAKGKLHSTKNQMTTSDMKTFPDTLLEYSPMFTSPSANNCLIVCITLIILLPFVAM